MTKTFSRDSLTDRENAVCSLAELAMQTACPAVCSVKSKMVSREFEDAWARVDMDQQKFLAVFLRQHALSAGQVAFQTVGFL